MRYTNILCIVLYFSILRMFFMFNIIYITLQPRISTLGKKYFAIELL